MLKIVMCEDEEWLRDIMAEYVNNIILDNKLNANIALVSDNYEEIDLFIDTCKADLYILDVDLKSDNIDNNGVKLAKTIRQKSKDSFILFVSGSEFNMNDIFEIKAYNCLAKPFSLEYLENMILKIYDEFIEINNSIDNIMDIKCNIDNKNHMVKCSNIIYVEKSDNECMIHCYDGKFIKTNMTLKQIENICNDKLTRVHKSFLCNVKYIHTVDYRNNEIKMETGEIVLLGGKYVENFRIINGC